MGRRMRWGTLAVVLAVAGTISGPVAFGALRTSNTTTPAAAPTNDGHLQASTASTPSGATRQVPSVLSGLSLATLLSTAPPNHVMTVGVSVQRPDPQAVNQLYTAIYDPSSPLYHHFLTPAQFDQQFGLSSAQVSDVEHWLSGGGLTLDSISGDGTYLTASGTVAELDRLFDVSIGTYRFDGGTFLANNVAPSVPRRLPVDDVLGLDTVQSFRPASLTGAVSNTSAVQPGAPHQGPQAGTEQTLTPQDLWGIYDDPGAAALTVSNSKAPSGTTSDPGSLMNSKYDLGQGQTAGIFGEGETSSPIAQMRLFEAALGLPKVPVRTVYTEGKPGSAYGDNGGAIEWYLDSQAITGMAPDLSQLDFYFSKSLYDYDVFQAFSYWVNDPGGPRQMNASFGECEANPSDPVTNPLAEVPYGTEYGDQLQIAGEPMLEQATIEGRTLFSSAGDTGSGCPEVVVPVGGAGNGVAVQPVPDVNYPCTSNYVVCVGGTVVSVNGASYPQSGQRTAETSWTFGGGGSSFYLGEPAFQRPVANVNMPCVSTPQGDPYPPGSGPTCRGAPDVSDMSGNVTGDDYFIYIDGKPSSEGGTSLSSPLMVGQWTRVQAGASSKTQSRGGLGFAAPVIYGQASSADACSASATATAAQMAACTSRPYTQDFTDVTESEYGIGNGAYQPGPGWDYASGWGALNVADFIADVDCSAQSDGCAKTPAGTTYSLGNWKPANGPGEIVANAPYGGAEKAAPTVTTATLHGPQGWSTDPVDASAVAPGPNQAPGGPPVPIPGDNTTPNYDPSLDITGASLTANAKTITVTISGPYLGALPPPTAGAGGNSYFVTWLYQGTVYYARANESALTGAWSYTSGDTSGGAYNDAATTAATGSLDQTGGGDTLTIVVPESEVGSPPAGAVLTDPQAFSVLDAGTPAAFLELTTDSTDDLVPASQLADSGGTGDCTAPPGRTLEGKTDSSPWSTSHQGEQVLLCSVAESQGVAVQVQSAPAPASAGGSPGSSPSTSIGPLDLPSISAPGGLSLPSAALPLGILGSPPPAAGATSKAKLP
jgi:pseudomonalisin